MNLTITEAAAKKVASLLEQNPINPNPGSNGPNNKGLRVYVEGGGCSGMKYGFAFESEFEDGDNLVSQHGVLFIVDAISGNYLDGASIDYVEDIMGSTFKIVNPNATGSCGCGSSFAV